MAEHLAPVAQQQLPRTNVDFLVSLFLTSSFMFALWLAFGVCKTCVLAVFLISSFCCIRYPMVRIVFWSSLIVLVLNVHLLRNIHITSDIPIGKTIDNMFSKDQHQPVHEPMQNNAALLAKTLNLHLVLESDAAQDMGNKHATGKDIHPPTPTSSPFVWFTDEITQLTNPLQPQT